MKPLKHTVLGLIFTGLAGAGLANVAVAADSSCLDNNNLICIQETYDATQSASKNNDISRYTITNNSDTRVFAFAVTNAGGNGFQAYLDQDLLGGWEGKTIGVTTWDGSQSAINFSNAIVSTDWLTGKKGTSGYTELGNFVDLFGETTDGSGSPLYANIYWNSGTENALTTGVTLDNFYFYGLPESNFVAFDFQGQVIQSSLTTPVDTPIAAVPEPSEYAMLISGIALILLTRKRKA